ncbi:MAG: hypothetical protein A3F43_06225 [Gammaproteobacteria bacterium RIFCSPHIGHO2_12_FULL_42_10]|nr:MAG: hypothetical protein A3F43_06225 [Gammaproteobacteria bacterium RIFCSPHIGHO2_12_FULL_42_10]
MRIANGFSLIELMIVIAIIGILTVIGIPSYQEYTKRARFIEVITAVLPYKTAVSLAIQSGFSLSALSSGMHGIPDSPKSTKHVASITVENGAITATATPLLSNTTYILKPNEEGSHWAISGTCLKNGLCNDA